MDGYSRRMLSFRSIMIIIYGRKTFEREEDYREEDSRWNRRTPIVVLSHGNGLRQPGGEQWTESNKRKERSSCAFIECACQQNDYLLGQGVSGT